MKKFLFFLMAATMLAGGAVAKHNCGCEGCEVCKVEHKLRHKQMEKADLWMQLLLQQLP